MILVTTRPSTLTPITNSKEVHTTCLAFVNFAETYFGTHFLYRVPYSYFLHLFAPLPERECLPFPPCQKRIVDGPIAGRGDFLRGCTSCVHLFI